MNRSCIFNRDNQSELCIDRHNIECPLNGSEIEIEHFSAAKRLHHYPFVWYRGGQCEVSSSSGRERLFPALLWATISNNPLIPIVIQSSFTRLGRPHFTCVCGVQMIVVKSTPVLVNGNQVGVARRASSYDAFNPLKSEVTCSALTNLACSNDRSVCGVKVINIECIPAVAVKWHKGALIILRDGIL